MAALTVNQFAEVRQGCALSDAVAGITIAWTKTQINAAIQACEDYYEATARAGFGSAMEAVAPGVFTNAQKKIIGGYFLKQKFFRENI